MLRHQPIDDAPYGELLLKFRLWLSNKLRMNSNSRRHPLTPSLPHSVRPLSVIAGMENGTDIPVDRTIDRTVLSLWIHRYNLALHPGG